MMRPEKMLSGLEFFNIKVALLAEGSTWYVNDTCVGQKILSGALSLLALGL